MSRQTVPDTFYNERGEEGKADGFFYVENGLYKATLMAKGVWRSPKGRKRERRFVATYAGHSARDLAKRLRENGFEPPVSLRRLCESGPRNSFRGRR